MTWYNNVFMYGRGEFINYSLSDKLMDTSSHGQE